VLIIRRINCINTSSGIITLCFHFSTCFEQPSAHHQENQLYQYIIWYISLCVFTYLHVSNNPVLIIRRINCINTSSGIITLGFHLSTCFEQPSAHHQENQLYQYIIWYISLCVFSYLHVSNNAVLIIRRINCINSSSGIYLSV
jgi:hypothetical protein